ncbi:hypothetical protein DL96DRAFT_588349 [Flagelloscypha sp. PMI_526]|nr:hypothetical protein DL96DRAFT_588349 [Flagelloscypha sp. PMI_526]
MDTVPPDYQLHFARRPSGVSTSRSPLFVATSPRETRPSWGALRDSSDSISSLSSASSAQGYAPRSCLRAATNPVPFLQLRKVPKASVAPCSISFATVDSSHWNSSSPIPSLSSLASASSVSPSEVHTPPEDLLSDVARQSILRRRKRKTWSSAGSSSESECAFSPGPVLEAANHVDFVLPVPPPTPLSDSSDSSSSSYEDLFDEVQVVFKSCKPRNRAPPTPVPYTTEYCSPTHLYTVFLEEIRASRPPPALVPHVPRVKQIGFDVDEDVPMIFAPIPTCVAESEPSLSALLMNPPPSSATTVSSHRVPAKPDLRLRRGGGLRGKKRPRT